MWSRLLILLFTLSSCMGNHTSYADLYWSCELWLHLWMLLEKEYWSVPEPFLLDPMLKLSRLVWFSFVWTSGVTAKDRLLDWWLICLTPQFHEYYESIPRSIGYGYGLVSEVSVIHRPLLMVINSYIVRVELDSFWSFDNIFDCSSLLGLLFLYILGLGKLFDNVSVFHLFFWLATRWTLFSFF